MKSSKRHKKDNNLNIFRLLRIARDKKVKDIANELSVTSAYINAIENGERFPSERLLRDYAKVLEVNEEIIKNFKPEKQKNQRFEHILLRILQMICDIDDTKS